MKDSTRMATYDGIIPAKNPLVFFDTYDEGYCEDKGWVEATVTEDKARDILAEYCFDEDGREGFRPVGSIKKVYLCPEDKYAEGWTICSQTEKKSIEFWEIYVY